MARSSSQMHAKALPEEAASTPIISPAGQLGFVVFAKMMSFTVSMPQSPKALKPKTLKRHPKTTLRALGLRALVPLHRVGVELWEGVYGSIVKVVFASHLTDVAEGLGLLGSIVSRGFKV